MGETDTGDAERPPEALDDTADREELRRRYEMLLQELRVVLPGVQVLVAFLLTVPFAQRFGDIDDLGRALFGGALLFSMLSVVAFVTPAAMHRFGQRTARSAWLAVAIAMVRAGLLLLGAALVLALTVVSRFLYNGLMTALLVGAMTLAIATFWIALPLSTHWDERGDG